MDPSAPATLFLPTSQTNHHFSTPQLSVSNTTVWFTLIISEPKKYTDMEQERKELQEYQRKTGITSDNFKKSASQYYAEAPAPELLYFEASLAIATGPLDDFLEDIKNHSEWKNPDYTAAREACETQTICSALEDLKIAGVEKMDDMVKGVESRAKNEAIHSAKHMEDNRKRDILRPVCSPLALFTRTWYLNWPKKHD